MRLYKTYGVHASCETWEYSAQPFYHYQRRRPEQTMVQKQDEILKPNIEKVFYDTKGRLGSKKVGVKLLDLGFTVSISRVTRLMKEMDLSCVSNGNAPKSGTTAQANITETNSDSSLHNLIQIKYG